MCSTSDRFVAEFFIQKGVADGLSCGVRPLFVLCCIHQQDGGESRTKELRLKMGFGSINPGCVGGAAGGRGGHRGAAAVQKACTRSGCPAMTSQNHRKQPEAWATWTSLNNPKQPEQITPPP